jgi:phosphoribosyl 1,2-cyclic phosphodiesterase
VTAIAAERNAKTRGALAAPVVTFWGVRGSLPTPGPDTAVFGGNTTCLEIETPAPGGARRFIVDAGSGLPVLGRARDWAETGRIDRC